MAKAIKARAPSILAAPTEAAVATSKPAAPVPFKLDPQAPPWTPESFFEAWGEKYRVQLEKRPYSLIVWGEEPIWHTPIGRVRLRPHLIKQLVALGKRFNAQPAAGRSVDQLRADATALVESYYAKSGRDAEERAIALELAQALVGRLEDFADGPSHEMIMAEEVGAHLQPVDMKVLPTSAPALYRGSEQLRDGSNVPEEDVRKTFKQTKKTYAQPGRDGKRLIGAYVESELADELQAALQSKGVTVQEFFTDAVTRALVASRTPAQLDKLVARIVKKKASAYRAGLLASLKK